MTSQPAQNPSETPVPTVERRELTVRRAPKFVPFMIAGALAGVVTAAIFTLLSPGVEQFEPSSIFGFFTVLLMVPGAGLGAIVALVIDRQSVRRARSAIVESVPDNEGGPDAGQETV